MHIVDLEMCGVKLFICMLLFLARASSPKVEQTASVSRVFRFSANSRSTEGRRPVSDDGVARSGNQFGLVYVERWRRKWDGLGNRTLKGFSLRCVRVDGVEGQKDVREMGSRVIYHLSTGMRWVGMDQEAESEAKLECLDKSN
jgi:hypothetical protein